MRNQNQNVVPYNQCDLKSLYLEGPDMASTAIPSTINWQPICKIVPQSTVPQTLNHTGGLDIVSRYRTTLRHQQNSDPSILNLCHLDEGDAIFSLLTPSGVEHR